MQIIIDIPKDIYEDIMVHNREMREGGKSAYYFEGLIQNGTPLPKGHGRLIDIDYLREDFKASKKISFAERMDVSCIVDHAPTIIEADKIENEVNNG